MRTVRHAGFLASARNDTVGRYVSFKGAYDGVLPSLRKILPLWILRLDQSKLFCSAPSFYLLFTGNSCIDIGGFLKTHQLMNMVATRKTRNKFIFMLVKTTLQVVCYPCVQNRMGFIRQQINVIQSNHLFCCNGNCFHVSFRGAKRRRIPVFGYAHRSTRGIPRIRSE